VPPFESSPLHVSRVATFQAVRVLEDCRAHDRACLRADAPPILRGLTTGSVACYNLLFAEEDVPYGGTVFKVHPPIRHEAHRRALWGAVKSGTLDVVTSGHSPVDPRSKPLGWGDGDFSRAVAGSLLGANEVFLPAWWTAARPEGFDLVDVARLLAFGPAHLLKLTPRKGVLTPRADADFVIFDPDVTWTVDSRNLVAGPHLQAANDRDKAEARTRLALRRHTQQQKASSSLAAAGGTASAANSSARRSAASGRRSRSGKGSHHGKARHHHNHQCLYDGKRLTGAVVATVLRGRLVYCRGKFRQGPTLGNVLTTKGRVVRRADGADDAPQNPEGLESLLHREETSFKEKRPDDDDDDDK